MGMAALPGVVPMRLFHSTLLATRAYSSTYIPPVCEALGSVASVAVTQLLLATVFCSSTPPREQYTAALPEAVLLVTTQVESTRYSGWSSAPAAGSMLSR